ncbi:MAG: SCO family protein [Acidobacteria bacterium]|nr:SCO family protein [Acidobacteriota bacterium]
MSSKTIKKKVVRSLALRIAQAVSLLALSSALFGQSQYVNPSGAPPEWINPATVSPEQLKGVTIDQRLNSQIDLDLEFTDSEGKRVRLGDFFGDKPVVLSLVYYDCPMLCTLELNGLLKAMRALDLSAGKDYEVLTVSFDARETPELAAEKKDLYVRQYIQGGFYDRTKLEDGWKFLVGEPEAIKSLADSVGFKFQFDEARNLFRHASGIVTLTPEGRVSRYQFGVEYSARDLKFNLMEASKNEIGGLADAVMLYCFHYDPVSGKYGFVVMNALRVTAGVTLLLLGGFVILSLLRDRRRRAEESAALG